MSKASALFDVAPLKITKLPKREPSPEKKSSRRQEKKTPPVLKPKLTRYERKQMFLGIRLDKQKKKNKKQLEEKRPYVDGVMSMAEVKQREERTIFVGNVGLKTEKRELLKVFRKFGKVEKMWVRSLPLDLKSKINMRG